MKDPMARIQLLLGIPASAFLFIASETETTPKIHLTLEICGFTLFGIVIILFITREVYWLIKRHMENKK